MLIWCGSSWTIGGLFKIQPVWNAKDADKTLSLGKLFKQLAEIS